MTLYSYKIIFNPINDWIAGRNYFVGNKVKEGSNFFQCNANNLSVDPTNKPPNGSFWTPITPTSPNQDVTKFMETLKETEIGSGEVRSLALRFNANKGAFITNTNSGATPIIDEFDKFTIEITDRFGTKYVATYEVDIIHPTQDGSQGTVLPVDLLGSEFYLQKTLFSDQFFFKSMFTTAKGIIDFYNTNKGEDQVRIAGADADSSSTGFNDLPVFTANDYTFNLNEKSHYDGEMEVIDRGGSSVAAGGAGDFFELAFTSNPTNAEEINFRAFSSGNPSDQAFIPNIRTTSVVLNPAEQEGEIDATVGTVTGTWCAESIGTLPRQNADFIGALEAWRLFPTYVASTVPEDTIIQVVNTLDSQGDNFHYKANKQTSSVPPVPPTASNADWDQYFFTQFLTTEVIHIPTNYSFWTAGKSIQWRSNGAKTGGNIQNDPPTDDSIKVWDSNQVKFDGIVRQTWADVRAVNEAAIGGGFKRNGQVYRGFRVLVDGVGLDEFSGFDNDVIQWDGTQWIIFLRPETSNLVGIDDESRTYQFDTDVSNAWADITTSLNESNDVYHSVFNITNTQGQNNKNNGTVGGNGATATANITLGFLTSITPGALGSGYTANTIVRITGGGLLVPGLEARVTPVISGGTVTSYTIINAGFGYTTTPTVEIIDGGGNFGQTSAVTYEFRMSDSDSASLDNPTFYRQFVGACFRVPYPFNANNGNTIGKDYGDNNDRLPATFEAENMGLTSSGLSGFNNIEAEDLGPFDALTFFIKHEHRYFKDASGFLVQIANFAYRCVLYDIDDSVVTSDFVVPFNNLWEPISLAIGTFKPYKARAAWAFGNIGQNIFLNELEVLNTFRWRNIKKIAIHWLGPYDDQGRFRPQLNTDLLFPSITDVFVGLFVDGYNVKLSLDSFQWSHPGLSVSPPDTSRPLQPQFFYKPFITNKFQNDQANLAKLEITKFRHKEFEITSVGKNDLKYGDSFFLENPKLVNEDDMSFTDLESWLTATKYVANENDVQNQGTTGYRCIQSHTSATINEPGVGANFTEFWDTLVEPIPNTIKLVAKKIIRLIDKVPDGAGGFLRTVTGIRRFT